MALASNDQIKTLLATLIERLENTPVEFVEQLVDLLAAPERKRDEQLLRDLLMQIWLLLECPESFEQSASPISESKISIRSARVTPYERTIQLICRVIETEIVRHLHFARDTPFFIGGKTSHLFWGGLTLHIKLALPLEPQHGSAIFSNEVVTLSNRESFSCELPLSESKIYQLLAQLRHTFVSEYVASYVCDERLRDVVARISQGTKKGVTSKNGTDPLELLVQERTLNRYVDKFAKRLAAHFRDGCERLIENPTQRIHTLLSSSSIDSVLDQMIAEATSALLIQYEKFESLRLEPTANQSHARETTNNSLYALPPISLLRTFDSTDTWDSFKRVQEETIQDSIHAKYVVQNLELQNFLITETLGISFDELVGMANSHLFIVAPPGGGKTRLLQELVLRATDSAMYPLYIDLVDFTETRFRTFYQFAADQILIRLGQDRATIFQFENDLSLLDVNGKITWYLDGWDDLPITDLQTVTRSIGFLSHFFLATSNPSSAIELFKANRVALSGTVSIKPFTQRQVEEFMKTNFAEPSTRPRIERRALQLPGLAQLPNGLQYICTHPEHETVIDVLFGYINFILQEFREPIFKPDDLVLDGAKQIAFGSEILTSAYFIVKAITHSQTGLSKNFPHIVPDEIIPYMGASDREKNRQLAIERIDATVRGKFMQPTGNQTFRYVVPEIAYLLASLGILSQHRSGRRLNFALGQFRSNPHDSFYQMMLALGAWYREKLTLWERPAF